MKLISFRTIHAIHSNRKIMWVVNPHYLCQLGFRQNLSTFRSKRVSQVIAHNSNCIYCQELYDLVSGQHMNVCPTGFHKVRLVNMVCHLARNRGPKDSAEYHTEQTVQPACSLLSYSIDDPHGRRQFSFVIHTWDECDYSRKCYFS